MDAKGARLLRIRIAIGAAPGQRVEVIAVEADDDSGVVPGDRGTLLSFGEYDARVAFDSGEERVVDPFVVRLRPVAQVA